MTCPGCGATNHSDLSYQDRLCPRCEAEQTEVCEYLLCDARISPSAPSYPYCSDSCAAMAAFEEGQRSE